MIGTEKREQATNSKHRYSVNGARYIVGPDFVQT